MKYIPILVELKIELYVSGLCHEAPGYHQTTNFLLWANGKTYFFHVRLSAGHLGFHS